MIVGKRVVGCPSNEPKKWQEPSHTHQAEMGGGMFFVADFLGETRLLDRGTRSLMTQGHGWGVARCGNVP
jgi:hypothetical protein